MKISLKSIFIVLLIVMGVMPSTSAEQCSSDSTSLVIEVIGDPEVFMMNDRSVLWNRGEGKSSKDIKEIKYFNNSQAEVSLLLNTYKTKLSRQIFLSPDETLYLTFEQGKLFVKGNSLIAKQNRLLENIESERSVISEQSSAGQINDVTEKVSHIINNFQKSHKEASEAFMQFVQLDNKYFNICNQLKLNPDVSMSYHTFTSKELKMFEEIKEDEDQEYIVNSLYFRHVLKAYIEYLRIEDPLNRLKGGSAFLENEVLLSTYFESGILQDYVAAVGLHRILKYEVKNQKYEELIEAHAGEWKQYISSSLKKSRSRLHNVKDAAALYPDLIGEYYDGETFKLSDLKGKWVIIDVWATWCGPCKKETPYVEKLKKLLNNDKVEVIYLSVDDQKNKDHWRKITLEKKMTGIRVLSDDKKHTRHELRTGAVPQFVIISPEGKLYKTIPKISTGYAHHMIMGL